MVVVKSKSWWLIPFMVKQVDSSRLYYCILNLFCISNLKILKLLFFFIRGCDPRRGIVFSPPHRQLYPRPFAPRPTIPVSQQHLSPVNSPLLPPTPPQHLVSLCVRFKVLSKAQKILTVFVVL